MRKILTITIPSYNVQEYLGKTLDSICKCGELEKIEVLVVNDGSKDETSILAHKYEEKYPFSVKVIDKENGGHGSTINRGLLEAEGAYFKVVDGDDWVDTKELDNLVVALENETAHMVLSPFTICNVETGEEEVVSSEELAGVKGAMLLSYADILPQILHMHAVTYKTSTIRNAKLTLTEKCFYVDMEYLAFPLNYIKTISYLDYNVYRYRIGRKDQSVNWPNMIKNIEMHSKVLDALIEDYNSQQLPPKTDTLYRKIISDMIRVHYLTLLHMKRNGENYKKCLAFRKMYRVRFGKPNRGKLAKLMDAMPVSYWLLPNK